MKKIKPINREVKKFNKDIVAIQAFRTLFPNWKALRIAVNKKDSKGKDILVGINSADVIKLIRKQLK
jgi:hypothetical protein